MKYNILLSIALVGIIFCVNYFILYKERTIANGHKYSLNRDGFCLYKNVLNNGEIAILKQLCIDKNYKTAKELVLHNSKLIDLKNRICGEDYVFQDYIWIIQKSTVHTCHRDNNGDFLMRRKNTHLIRFSFIWKIWINVWVLCRVVIRIYIQTL